MLGLKSEVGGWVAPFVESVPDPELPFIISDTDNDGLIDPEEIAAAMAGSIKQEAMFLADKVEQNNTEILFLAEDHASPVDDLSLGTIVELKNRGYVPVYAIELPVAINDLVSRMTQKIDEAGSISYDEYKILVNGFIKENEAEISKIINDRLGMSYADPSKAPDGVKNSIRDMILSNIVLSASCYRRGISVFFYDHTTNIKDAPLEMYDGTRDSMEAENLNAGFDRISSYYKGSEKKVIFVVRCGRSHALKNPQPSRLSCKTEDLNSCAYLIENQYGKNAMSVYTNSGDDKDESGIYKAVINSTQSELNGNDCTILAPATNVRAQYDFFLKIPK